MPVLSKIASSNKEYDSYFDLMFYCLRCEMHHGLIIRDVDESRLTEKDKKQYEKNKKPKWSFNGNFELPTFTPSINVLDEEDNTICHSFIKDGKIQYLPDCKHSLAGKTINLPDLDKDFTTIINSIKNKKPKIMKTLTWQEHLKKVKKENKGIKHLKALKIASATFNTGSEKVSVAEITKAKGSKKPKLTRGKVEGKHSYTGPKDDLNITKFDMVLELELNRSGNKRVYIYDIGAAFIELLQNTTTQPDDLEGIKTLHKPLWNKELIIEEYRNNGYSLMYGTA